MMNYIIPQTKHSIYVRGAPAAAVTGHVTSIGSERDDPEELSTSRLWWRAASRAF